MDSIKISGIFYDVAVVPCDVDQYYYINCVVLPWCNLLVLPVELFNLNLRYLNLHCTSIKVLPREIKNLTNLEHLNISDNNLVKLPKEILNLEKINYGSICVNGNKFKQTYGSVRERLESLNNNGIMN